MKSLIFIFLAIGIFSELAIADNRCADLTDLVGVSGPAPPTMYEPQPFHAAKTLSAALATARQLRVIRSTSFLAFTVDEQLLYLNEANEAVSKLPTLLLRVFEKAGFELILVKDALINVPELAKTRGKYEYAGFTAGSDLRKSYAVAHFPKPSAPLGHVVMHELGHALSHSIGIIRAGVESNRAGLYAPYTNTVSDFDVAFGADEAVFKASPFGSANEAFAETMYYYFDLSPRPRLILRTPHVYAFWENWFGDHCKTGATR